MVNIFVGNLSFDSCKDDLHDLFSEFGDVEAVNLPLDRDTGKLRGFAFVEMGSGGETAIEQLNGVKHLGRKLRVSLANPKKR